jgi:small-conductance mechanosensitive channel
MDWFLTNFKELFAILNTPLLVMGESKIAFTSIIVAILAILITFKLAKFVAGLVGNALEKRGVDSGVKDSLERFTRYGIIAAGILFSLDSLGFSLNSLAALGAVLMVGIGFGLQNIAQNFISGIIILIERPVKVGDIVKVGSAEGKIIDIRVRSTIILTRDEVAIIVPNSKFVSEEVTNNNFNSNVIRQHLKVGVAYGSDTAKVCQVLNEILDSHPSVLKNPAAVVIFENFGESSLDFDLRFWSEDIWGAERILSDLRFKIDERFREENIQIPFPQRDLHLVSSNLKQFS